MIIIILSAVYLIFVNNVLLGLYTVTACVALWLEWDVGLNIGLLDVYLLASLPIVITLPKTHMDNNYVIKSFILMLIGINSLSSFFNPLLKEASLVEIFWDVYKSAYIPLLFFVFYGLVRKVDTVKILIMLIITSSTCSGFFGLIQAITQKPITIAVGTYAHNLAKGGYIQYFDILRSFGTLSAANHFGGFLIMPISITASILLTPGAVNKRKFLWMAGAIQVSALLLSLSRASLIGTVISLLIMCTFLKVYKNKKITLMIVTLIAFICIGEMAGFRMIPQRIRTRVVSIKNGKEDDAMTPRFQRWEYFYKRSLEKPLTGWGYITDADVSYYFDNVAASPHNSYLFLAVKHGYISLAILVTIIILILKKSLKNRNQSKDPFLKAINTAVFSSLIGTFGFSAMYDAYLQDSQIDLMFWIISAIVFRCSDFNKQGESVV